MVKSSLCAAFAAARLRAETHFRAEALECRTHQHLAARTPRIRACYPVPDAMASFIRRRQEPSAVRRQHAIGRRVQLRWATQKSREHHPLQSSAARMAASRRSTRLSVKNGLPRSVDPSDISKHRALPIGLGPMSAMGPGRVKIPRLGALRRISRPPSFQFGGMDLLTSQWQPGASCRR
jgi:hypothetical protein